MEALGYYGLNLITCTPLFLKQIFRLILRKGIGVGIPTARGSTKSDSSLYPDSSIIHIRLIRPSVNGEKTYTIYHILITPPPTIILSLVRSYKKIGTPRCANLF